MNNIKDFGINFYTGIDPEIVPIAFTRYKQRLKEAVKKEKATKIVKFDPTLYSKYFLVTIVAESMGKHMDSSGRTFIRLKAHIFVELFPDVSKAFEALSKMKEKMKKDYFIIASSEVEEFDFWSLRSKRRSEEKTLAKYQDE